MELNLAGKSVLVTGGVHGIGRTVARSFAAENARVAFTYRSDKVAADELAWELGADTGRAAAFPYDLGDPESAGRVVASVVEQWGGLDVVVANAVQRGPRRGAGERFEDVRETSWLPVLDTNLTGTTRLLQCAVAAMRPRGWGRIAVLSSHNALAGGRGQEFYGAAKAGLHGLAASLAWDAGPDGILVNVVCPGLTETEKVRSKLPAHVRDNEREMTPTGRLSTPGEIADAVLFLCSGANGNITGESLTVSGGR